MLKKENRLSSNYEFRLTHKYGKKIQGKFFYLYYLDRRKEDLGTPTKVGIVVSKKFSKIAVVRNRIKRIFREVIRRNFDKIQPGFWIVFHPKKSSLDVDYEKIDTELNKILQKVPFSQEF